MKRAALTVLASMALGLAGCAGAQLPEVPTASLRMHGATPEATVTIDDQIVGNFDEVAQRGVALPLGRHRITVQAPNFFPWDHEVEATEKGKRIDLDVKLVPVPY